MQQHEFIWMGGKLNLPMLQNGDGVTTIDLRPQIKLVHEYKKKDQTLVVFMEDDSKFIISSKDELNDIIHMHLTNEHLEQQLLEYCKANLQKI